MKEILDKLSSYNIFNYLLPGVLFASIGTEISSYTLLVDNLAVGAFLYYFYGLVISRLGSLVVEPILKKLRIVHFADYSSFVTASHSDQKIDVLSEQNNSYRSLASLFLCLLMLSAIEYLDRVFGIGHTELLIIAVALLLVLFVSAYKKQTKYITNRVDAVLGKTMKGAANEADDS